MRLTPLVTIILIITLGIYDLAVVVFSGTESSVSAFLIRSGFKSPMFVFMTGYVAGHLWGSMVVKEQR